MESDKRKLHSPRNYRANTTKQDEGPPQQVDFSIFRRKGSENCSLASPNSITVGKNDHNMVAILGGIHLAYLSNHFQPLLFKEIDIANADRSFAQYLNEKTLHEFLRVFKGNITSLITLADVLNFYPVAKFFLEIYARQYAVLHLQSPTEAEEEAMMGNQFQVLTDCSCEPRGNSLDILSKSLKISLNIKHDEYQTPIGEDSLAEEMDEKYGLEDSCITLQLTIGTKQVTYTVRDAKKYISPMKRSKVELLQRRSRARQPQSGKTSTQSRSITKDHCCDECGKKRCMCTKLQASQYSNNAINLSKSLSGGLIDSEANDEAKSNLQRFKSLGMGFINVNKIVNRDGHKKY